MHSEFCRKENYRIEDLLTIMEMLRSENGCPWDREQTHESIRSNFLEETYEVIEAIDAKDPAMLREELGDVLLQVVFHARMEEESGVFSFDDVCDEICKKLIVRHPHIFGDVVADTAEEVLQNWDAIKRSQKGQKSQAETMLALCKAHPALIRSAKVQGKAAKVGFDYENIAQAMGDLRSEVEELQQALEAGQPQQVEEELGDLLFSVVNVSRFADVDAEVSLMKSCDKFIRRFARVEQMTKDAGQDMKTLSLEELDMLWKQAKKQDR